MKIGTKVKIPTSKRGLTGERMYEDSAVLRRCRSNNQDFVYYIGEGKNLGGETVQKLSDKNDPRLGGDYFEWKDIIPYNENDNYDIY